MLTPSTLPADWREHVVSRRMDIRVGTAGTLLPQEYIVLDSIELTEQVCDGKFHLGGVISSRFCFTVNTDCITFGDDSLSVSETITLDDETEHSVPIGQFYIDRSDSVVTWGETYFEGKYVAYDAFVAKTDRLVTAADAEDFRRGWHDAGEGELNTLLAFVSTKCGYMPDSATITAIAECANNSRLGINIAEDGSSLGYGLERAVQCGATYRDVLSAIAALAGGAFKSTRGGSYRFVPLAARAAVTRTFTATDRISSTVDTQPGRAVIETVQLLDIELSDPLSRNEYTYLTLSLGNNILLPDVMTSPMIQTPIVYQIAEALLRSLGSWGTAPDRYDDPIVLTTAEMTIFGDPTVEAGDFVRYETASGVTADFFVMQYVYRFRQPCIIRSYGDSVNNVYSDPSNPGYGEAVRSGGYFNLNTARQISALSSKITAVGTRADGIADDLSALSDTVDEHTEQIAELYQRTDSRAVYSLTEHQIGYWIDGRELFERTYLISPLGDSSTHSVTAELGIDQLIEIVESRGQLLGQDYSRPLNGIPLLADGSADIANAVSYSLSDTEITVTKGTADRSTEKAYITVRYTRYSDSEIYGYAVTQTRYDSISHAEKYYCVGEQFTQMQYILDVQEIGQSDYDLLTPAANTLYIIKDGTEIENVLLEDTQADRLYYGNTLLWEKQESSDWVVTDKYALCYANPSPFPVDCTLADLGRSETNYAIFVWTYNGVYHADLILFASDPVKLTYDTTYDTFKTPTNVTAESVSYVWNGSSWSYSGGGRYNNWYWGQNLSNNTFPLYFSDSDLTFNFDGRDYAP